MTIELLQERDQTINDIHIEKYAQLIKDNESKIINLLEKTPTQTSIEELESIKKEGEAILFHGGLPDNTTLKDIDLKRLGSQQNKRNRDFGGFYLTDISSKKWSENYAKSRNGNLHGFLLSSDTRVLEITEGTIDRMSINTLSEYTQQYDLIKGHDILGRKQYILLNKDKVLTMGMNKIETHLEDK